MVDTSNFYPLCPNPPMAEVGHLLGYLRGQEFDFDATFHAAINIVAFGKHQLRFGTQPDVEPANAEQPLHGDVQPVSPQLVESVSKEEAETLLSQIQESYSMAHKVQAQAQARAINPIWIKLLPVILSILQELLQGRQHLAGPEAL